MSTYYQQQVEEIYDDIAQLAATIAETPGTVTTATALHLMQAALQIAHARALIIDNDL